MTELESQQVYKLKLECRLLELQIADKDIVDNNIKKEPHWNFHIDKNMITGTSIVRYIKVTFNGVDYYMPNECLNDINN